MVDARNMLQMLGRLERKLKARLGSLVRKGTLTNSDSNKMQQELQVGTLADDTRDAEHVEPYGFTSNPPPGSEGVVLNVGGDTGHAVALNFGSRATRPTGLAPGEVAMYHLALLSLTLKNDLSVELVNPAGSVKIDPLGIVSLGLGTDFLVKGTTFNVALTALAAAEAAYGAAIAAAGMTHAGSAMLPPDNAAFITALVAAEATRTAAWATFIGLATTWLSVRSNTD